MSDALTATPASSAPTATKRKTRSYRLTSPLWALPAVCFLALFFLLPLGTNFLRSLGGAEDRFIYYRKLLFDAYYVGILGETLKVSIVTTLICLVAGYPVSYFMVRVAKRWNSVVVFCLIAPLLTSIIMRTFGWSVLFARRGLFNSFLVNSGILSQPLQILNQPIAVYIGLVHVLAPFMILSITAVLQSVDIRLEESARILGAGRLTTFLRITLPLSIDGIATGCILVFVLTNGSFLTMLLLGAGKVTTISLLIYQQFNLTQDVGFAAAMGNVLLLFALICLALQIRFVRRKGIKT